MLNKFRRFLKAREDSFPVLNLQKEKTRPLAIAGFDLHDQTQLGVGTNCTAGSCMEYLSPTDGDSRQHQGRSKTGLGIVFNQTAHVTMVNTSD